MKDAAEIIREFLIESGSTLYTLNAARVWFNKLPDGFNNSASAIVINLASETSELHGATIMARCNFRVYGGSVNYLTTRTLYRALYDRLHNKSGTNADGTILRAAVIQATMSADPDTDWPVELVTANINIEGT